LSCDQFNQSGLTKGKTAQAVVFADGGKIDITKHKNA